MTPRLRFFDEAAQEVEHERRWYRQRSESAEAAFLRELDHAIAAVLESPHMWPHYIASTRRYVFPTFPFSVVYFVEDNVVSIVSIAAERREPDTGKIECRNGLDSRRSMWIHGCAFNW